MLQEIVDLNMFCNVIHLYWLWTLVKVKDCKNEYQCTNNVTLSNHGLWQWLHGWPLFTIIRNYNCSTEHIIWKNVVIINNRYRCHWIDSIILWRNYVTMFHGPTMVWWPWSVLICNHFQPWSDHGQPWSTMITWSVFHRGGLQQGVEYIIYIFKIVF